MAEPSDQNNPKFDRDTQRMNCLGLDLNRPVDSVKPARFPYMKNCRSFKAGVIEPRYGMTNLGTPVPGQAPLHSIRRLNDAKDGTWVRVIGTGDHLAIGQSGAFTDLGGGFSGFPMALVPFQPPEAANPYMAIGDGTRMRKVRANGNLKTIGLPAPPAAPAVKPATFDTSGYKVVSSFNNAASWAFAGTNAPTAKTDIDRLPAATRITSSLYDSGTTGWCCIAADDGAGNQWAYGINAGMLINLAGTTADNDVPIQSVFPQLADTSISNIIYDSGTTLECSIVLGLSTGILCDALIYNSTKNKYARVLAATPGPDGTTSIRVSTAATQWEVNDVIKVYPSFRCWTTNNHVNPNGLSAKYIKVTTATGTGSIDLTSSLDLSKFTGGGDVSSDDYMYISVALVASPENLTSFTISLDTAKNTTSATYVAFGTNYYYKTYPASTFGDGWTTLKFKLSDLTHVGDDGSGSLATVNKLRLQMVTTGVMDIGIGSWWIGGGAGPDATSATATPYYYRFRARDLETNVASNFSPATRYAALPYRQSVVITPAQYSAPSNTTDTTSSYVLDIERIGGEIEDWHYIGTIENDGSSYTDILTDDIVGANPILANDNYQPWPVVGAPVVGTASSISGTSVSSSSAFDTSWAPGTQILIGGDNTVYTIYRVVSSSLLELVENAGSHGSTTYRIAAPVLLAQPLPCLWRFDDRFFACGDNLNAGRLYYSNASSETTQIENYIDVTSGSESLMNGVQYNTRSFVFSTENYYQILQTGEAANPYRTEQVPNGKGLTSRWALLREPAPVMAFLAKDGLQASTGGAPIPLTDADLYSLMPTEGNPGQSVNGVYYPIINKAYENLTRLAYYDDFMYFDYYESGPASKPATAEIWDAGVRGTILFPGLAIDASSDTFCQLSLTSTASTTSYKELWIHNYPPPVRAITSATLYFITSFENIDPNTGILSDIKIFNSQDTNYNSAGLVTVEQIDSAATPTVAKHTVSCTISSANFASWFGTSASNIWVRVVQYQSLNQSFSAIYYRIYDAWIVYNY